MPGCPAIPPRAGSPGSTGRCRTGTDAVILELGANDALRGIDPTVTKTALDTILSRLEERHIPVSCCAACWRRPIWAPTMCRPSTRSIRSLPRLMRVVLYPFFLDGVAADPKLNQRDGLHPTAAGVDVIVARILPQGRRADRPGARARGRKG